MRTLYYIPMIHTVAELGSMEKVIVRTREKIFGEKQTREFFDQVDWYWQEVGKRIETAGLYQPEIACHLNIFIDSLPNVEEAIVQKIVQGLIGQNIPAYRIIGKLQKAGAKVCGTEDHKLLLAEYQYWKDVSQGKAADPLVAEKILGARDMIIAKRIHAMVEEGKIGVLFIGNAHKVIPKLNGSFKVINL